MFDHSGFCTKRRSSSCTCQTTRSTANHKVIESFNYFRHHKAKRQAHLSGNYAISDRLKKNVCVTLRIPGAPVIPDNNSLEPSRVPEKQDGDQVIVSGELVIQEFQMFFYLCWAASQYLRLMRDSYFLWSHKCRLALRKPFPWYLRVCLLLRICCQAYASSLSFGDLLLIPVQEKGLIELSKLPEAYFMEKYRSFARCCGLITPPVWKFSWIDFFWEFHGSTDISWSLHVDIHAVDIKQLNNSYWTSASVARNRNSWYSIDLPDIMSLRTRINGFTAWVNLRLSPSGHFMHNILTDLLKGYNMKVLLESKHLSLFKNITLKPYTCTYADTWFNTLAWGWGDFHIRRMGVLVVPFGTSQDLGCSAWELLQYF